MKRFIGMFCLILAPCCAGTSPESLPQKVEVVSPAPALAPTVTAPVPVPAPEPAKPSAVSADKALNPMEAIKNLDKEIESYKTGKNLTQQDIEFNQALKKQIITGTFDIYELSRLALASHWDGLTEDQHQYFSTLMTQLIEKKAIFSKEQVKGTDKPYFVNYLSEEFLDADKQKAQVKTKVSVPSEKIDLLITYHLRYAENGWQIYDVIVDDASLVSNYKYQFHTIIQKSGYADLLDRMEKKLQSME